MISIFDRISSIDLFAQYKYGRLSTNALAVFESKSFHFLGDFCSSLYFLFQKATLSIQPQC